MEQHFERARLLMEQGRHEMAVREVRLALAANPNVAWAHCLHAHSLVALERLDEATEAARTAVHLAPDSAYAHYTLARVFVARNRFAEALAAIRTSIEIDPFDADYFAMLAAIHLSMKDWTAALRTADQALEINAEHVTALNVRAKALVMLGRPNEAESTLKHTLAKSPDDSFTHANQGWALLYARDARQALHHFREALRLDPTSDVAKAGLVEALKARNFLYRWMLGYFTWMSKLSGGAQWAIVIGGYVGFKFLHNVAKRDDALAPYIWPIIGLYIAFVVMSWLSSPLFDLILRLHPFGRYALSRDQVSGANWVGGCLAVALVAGLAAFITDLVWMFFMAIVAVAALIPLSSVYRCDAGWPRRVMSLYTVALVVCGVAGFALTMFQDAASPLLFVFGIATWASGFVANFLATQTPRL